MAADKENKNLFATLWEGLYSIRLTVFLLLILAAVSISGTLIPQNARPEEYLARLGPFKYQLFLVLGLLDVYHSWWFTALLILLSANLIACTWKRFPSIIRSVLEKKIAPPDSLFKKSGPLHEVTSRLDADTAAQRAETLLKQKGWKPARTDEGGIIHLFAEKGRYSRLGPTITHISILIILAGGLLGSIYGFTGFVNIAEGESAGKIYIQGENELKPLGFELLLNDFDVRFYRDGTPKEYRSEVTIIDGGRQVTRKIIRVNHPISYKGVKFYQASYGRVDRPRFVITARNDETGRTKIFQVARLELVDMDTDGARFMVTGYSRDRAGKGPAVKIFFRGGDGKSSSFWLYHSGEQKDDEQRERQWIFSLKGITYPYYSGLQVSKDPGVPVVWVGSVMLIFGIMLSLFTFHRGIYIRISGLAAGSRILVTGRAAKNRVAFGEELERLAGLLSESLKK